MKNKILILIGLLIYANGYAQNLKSFRTEGKSGFRNAAGAVIIPAQYEQVGNFSSGLAAVKLNNKWGYVDKTGNEIIPFKYYYVQDFSEGLAAVELNDKWG